MRRRRWAMTGLLLLALDVSVLRAQSREPSDKDVKELSLEELLSVEVTSVARKAQRLSDSAAAVYVLTRADIRRSGATTLPGVLRLVPGVEVAQIDSNKWAVSVRGFNNRFANKLLVLIDGRTAYSQLYSGTFWETIDLPLEDIERVEVIRGPGGTMWGANAVNGVINIITSHARESAGTLVSAVGESVGPGGLGTVRQGWHVGDTGGLRLYAKGVSRLLTNGPALHDHWNLTRVGFRADGGSLARGFSLQGSAYTGELGQTVSLLPTVTTAPQTAGDSTVRGGQFSGSLTRGRDDHSQLTVRSFLDYAYRQELLVTDRRLTADIDLQHRVALAPRHDVIWGGGYRRTNDDIVGTTFAAFAPRQTGADLYSAFVQDEIAVSPTVRVTAGTKFEHSTLAGGGWQPSARAIWTATPSHAVWGAVSRALRTPSRAELGVTVIVQERPPSAQVPFPTRVVREAGPDLDPEVTWAYEGGYRGRFGDRVSIDLAAFSSRYGRLARSVPGTPSVQVGAAGPFVYQPLLQVATGRAQSRGFEVAFEWRPLARVRTTTAYSYLHLNEDGTQNVGRFLTGRDPSHVLVLRGQVDLPFGVEFDPTLRAVSGLQDGAADPYAALDLHVGRRLSRALDVAFIGNNLVGADRIEFTQSVANTVPSMVQRALLMSITWRF